MTTIPTPPSHWMRARHNRMLRGMVSSPTNTVEPVVVIPDMVSKKASV
jgi:hypothetical protein